MNKENVIEFPKKRYLFSDELKTKIQDNVKDLSEDPEKVVDRTEQAICTFLVGLARRFGAKIGKALGEKIAAPKIEGAVNE